MKEEKTSEEFESAFSSGVSGPSMECECGRVLFDTANDIYDWEEGELERLEEGAKSHPGQFVRLSYGVTSLFIGGCTYVVGCPCNGAAKYERFLVNHAQQIADFLNARGEALRREADATRVHPEERTVLLKGKAVSLAEKCRRTDELIAEIVQILDEMPKQEKA